MTDTCTYIGDGSGCTHTVVPEQGTAVNRRKDQRTAESVWNIQDAFNEAITELEAEGFDCYGDSERLEA